MYPTSFNRTIVVLKLREPGIDKLAYVSFNRTIVVLKYDKVCTT